MAKRLKEIKLEKLIEQSDKAVKAFDVFWNDEDAIDILIKEMGNLKIMARKMKKIFLAIVLVLAAEGLALGESYFYYRQYVDDREYSNENLLIDPDQGLFLKQEWGLENDFHIPYGFLFEFDFRLLCSVCSFSDPPEEARWDLELSRVNWGWLKTGCGHGRRHNLSREDSGSFNGFGIYKTYCEAGILFK